VSMRILHYYIIYKMGICQLEWWPRKRTKSYKKSKGWSGRWLIPNTTQWIFFIQFNG
jgi:hypothetical protein